jgi:tellurite resistance protein TehA-like permease
MVASATGAALVAHWLCWTCFGISLVATLVILPRIQVRVERDAVPGLWVVLGPLGQSVTAANLLGPRAVGLAYGWVVWACAMAWIAYVLPVTLRARPRFTFAFWAFTFPLGTVVTGTSALHLTDLAGVLFAGLLVGWGVAAGGTVRYLSAAARTTRAAGAAVSPPAP